MMKIQLTILSAILTISAFAQEDDKYKEWILTQPVRNDAFFSDNVNYNDRNNLYALSKEIFALIEAQEGDNFDIDGDPLKNHHRAIIVVHNDLKYSSGVIAYDLTKVNSILLHKERKPGTLMKKEWSEYLYQTRDVYIILLGNTGLDDENKPLNIKLNITNSESFFRTSFKDLVEVIKELVQKGAKVTDAIDQTDGIRCRVIKLSKTKVNPPTDFDFSIPVLKEETTEDKSHPVTIEFNDVDVKADNKLNEPLSKVMSQVPSKAKVTLTVSNTAKSLKPDVKKFSYKIHERNNFAFSIGIIGNKFDYHDFSLDTIRNIAIAQLDSVKKKEWKSNLNVNIEFYPFGRDIDQLEPLLKKPLHKLHTRFGIIGGVKLSKDPLSAVNLGLAFSYSKTVTITWGYSWLDNRIRDQAVKVNSDVNTLDQAKEYFSSHYERSRMTLGISFSPVQIAKALGIGEKDDEKSAKEEKKK